MLCESTHIYKRTSEQTNKKKSKFVKSIIKCIYKGSINVQFAYSTRCTNSQNVPRSIEYSIYKPIFNGNSMTELKQSNFLIKPP